MKLVIHNIYRGAEPRTYVVELTGDGVDRKYTLKMLSDGARFRPLEGEFFRFFMRNGALLGKIVGAIQAVHAGSPPDFPLIIEDPPKPTTMPPGRPQ